ncbi:MAG: AmpD protein [Alteromonadaceae bacterium]|jgi:AmpD protein
MVSFCYCMMNFNVSQLKMKKTSFKIKILEMLKRLAMLEIRQGWLQNANHQPSPHYSYRDEGQEINLLVVHNISLPPRQFGGTHIIDFFQGKLNVNADPYFEEIHQLKVSAHCLIDRKGAITQFVSFNDKAWHAGVSSFKGKAQCNDFSIGIELEGADDIPYTEAQYQQLVSITLALGKDFPDIVKNGSTSQQKNNVIHDFENIVGHNDIAPGRKTDPGEVFDWKYLNQCLEQALINNANLKEEYK